MSVNISVSGKTLKECHDQICALADEIVGNTKDAVKDPIASEPVPMVGVAFPGTPAPVKFNIGPSEAPVITTQRGDIAAHGEAPVVDSRGLPWDSRIHSSNKEQGKDGVWRRRRGVDPELEKQVEAELFAAKGVTPPGQVKPFGSMSPEQYQQAVAPAPVAAPAPMPTTEHRVSLPEVGNVLNQVQIPTQAAPTFAPPAPAQVLPPNTHTAESFRNNLLAILNDLVVAGKIDHNWVNSQKPMFGGKDVVQWNENLTACNSLFEAFVQWGFINKL